MARRGRSRSKKLPACLRRRRCGIRDILPGVAHGCIIAGNRNYYGATAWTEDGLFAGFFFDRHANDLPDWACEPAGRGLSGMFAGDDWECAGSLAELADGSVLWIPRASGRAAVFRVRGWENWFRASGKIELKQTPPAAVPDGQGLAATYFRGKDFAGPPVVSRVDARLWFTSGAGDKRVASWATGPCEGITAAEPFGVRWTGRLVAPFSEGFWFRLYNQSTDASFIQAQWWKAGAGSARVWLNDVLIAEDVCFESAPVRLIAGHSYDVKIEYTSPGIAKPEFVFSWASNTKEWKRVPTAYLHADTAPIGPAVRVTNFHNYPDGFTEERNYGILPNDGIFPRHLHSVIWSNSVIPSPSECQVFGERWSERL